MASLFRAIRSQCQKIIKFIIFGPLIFLNCERMCYLTDILAWNYDRKTDVRPFDTTFDILRCLSLVKSLVKGQNAPIWRIRKPTHMRLSGTDGLTFTTVNHTFFRISKVWSTLQILSIWFKHFRKRVPIKSTLVLKGVKLDEFSLWQSSNLTKIYNFLNQWSTNWQREGEDFFIRYKLSLKIYFVKQFSEPKLLIQSYVVFGHRSNNFPWKSAITVFNISFLYWPGSINRP